MARLVTCGWESGSVYQAPTVTGTVGSNLTVTSTSPGTGRYCLYINSTGRSVSWALSGNPDEIYFRVRFRFHGGYITNCPFVRLLDSTGASQISININIPSGTIDVRRGAYNGTTIATGATTLVTSTYYCLEGHVLVANIGGEVTLKLNGVQEATYSGDTQATANADVGRFTVGGVARALYGRFDDISVNDTTGAKNNSWCGQGRVFERLVNGDGDNIDLTPSTGSNWQCVDERPPNDATDYVSGSSVEEYDLYSLPATVQTGNIAVVQVITRASLSSASGESIATVIKPSVTETDSTDVALTTSWVYVITPYELNPETAADWSFAEIDTTQIGVKVR